MANQPTKDDWYEKAGKAYTFIVKCTLVLCVFYVAYMAIRTLTSPEIVLPW